MKVSIIVPAYNEEDGIGPTLKKLIQVKRKIKQKTEIVVVNDGSTDNTSNIVKQYPVKLIGYRKNSGKGSVLKKVFKKIKSDIFVTTDADNTYDSKKIPLLVNKIANSDAEMIIGSRFLGKISGGMSRLNWVGNILFSTMVSVLTGTKITDASSGLRAFRSDLTKVPIKADGLDFEVEFTTAAISKGFKVIEEPILYKERIGRSKLHPLIDGWRFFKAIIRAYIEK